MVRYVSRKASQTETFVPSSRYLQQVIGLASGPCYKRVLQVALPMTRQTKHPRTGTYLVRLVIPSDLRETTKRLFGVQAEFQENLRTKDPSEAKRRAPDAIARLHAKLEQARAIGDKSPARPSARDIAALAGDWYRRRVGANGRRDEQDLHWDVLMELAESDAHEWSD